jgi:hypothetical protein
MKLIRHGIPGKELPGILHEGKNGTHRDGLMTTVNHF